MIGCRVANAFRNDPLTVQVSPVSMNTNGPRIPNQERDDPTKRPELPHPAKDPLPEIPDVDTKEPDEPDMIDPDKQRREHPDTPMGK